MKERSRTRVRSKSRCRGPSVSNQADRRHRHCCDVFRLLRESPCLPRTTAIAASALLFCRVLLSARSTRAPRMLKPAGLRIVNQFCKCAASSDFGGPNQATYRISFDTCFLLKCWLDSAITSANKIQEHRQPFKEIFSHNSHYTSPYATVRGRGYLLLRLLLIPRQVRQPLHWPWI